MASIVCENGYRLRSSGTKTESGQAHFKAFARNYPEIVTKEDGYYFIDINLEDNIALCLLKRLNTSYIYAKIPILFYIKR